MTGPNVLSIVTDQERYPSDGLTMANPFTNEPFDAVSPPCSIESVVAPLSTGAAGSVELWKPNQYSKHLDEWFAARGFTVSPFLTRAAEPLFELHNLTADPQERRNRATTTPAVLSELRGVLEGQRDQKRLVPALRSRVG